MHDQLRVLAETHAFLLHRVNNRLALRVIQDISDGATTVERVVEDDEQRVIEILVQYDDKDSPTQTRPASP